LVMYLFTEPVGPGYSIQNAIFSLLAASPSASVATLKVSFTRLTLFSYSNSTGKA
jgi:hypothetical protein